MIVKANVVDKESGLRKDAYFLVRFDHTPAKKVVNKNNKVVKRRKGLCSIYYLSDSDKLTDFVGNVIEGQFFASRICGEKYKYFIVDQKIECNPTDNYVKAYARTVTMQMALNWIMKWQSDEDFLKTLPFTFDNETFKSFMTTLNTQHPHGKDAAMELIRNSNYRISK